MLLNHIFAEVTVLVAHSESRRPGICGSLHQLCLRQWASSGYSRSLLSSTHLQVFLVAYGSGICHWSSNSQGKAVILTFSHNLHLLSHSHQAPAVLNSGSLSTNGHYSVPAPMCLFGFWYSLLSTCLKISPQTPTVFTMCSLLWVENSDLSAPLQYGSSLEHTLMSQSLLGATLGQDNVGQVMILDCLTPVIDEFFYWQCSAKPTIESLFYNSNMI